MTEQTVLNGQALWAIALFLLSYALIISEKLHRTIVAMCGAILMIFFGIIDQETALHHIDFNTLGLLIGMMIIVTVTAETGLFKFIAVWAAKKAGGRPMRILVSLAAITAVASALLDNVTTVLLIVPVTFMVTRKLNVNPIPYLLTEVFCSNIGGTATLIGDPPNIMLGSAVKELTFMAFIVNLTPIIIVIAAVTIGILAFVYRKQLVTTDALRQEIMALDPGEELTDRPLLRKCLIVLTLTIAGFFLHQFVGVESSVIALAGAFLLLLLSGEHHMENALVKVEWTTIFFFIGLFVLVGGLVETHVISWLAERAVELTGGNVRASSMLILWLSAVASAFIDNIPFVATMIPLIQDMGHMGMTNLEPLWWSLSLGACLGGNGTLIGASANVVVAGLAAKEGHPITFVRFMAIGFPLMILSIVISTVYIWLRYLL